ncbi:MAG: ABC transporter substrate-binding protein [Galbitalea sp.]
MNPGGEDPTLQKLSNNLISNIPNIKTEIDAMLPYLKKHGIKKLAMYAEGDALGATASEAVQEEWQKLGGTFLGAQQEPITVTDHSSVIAKLRSQDPDAVYVLAGGQQAGSFLKQQAAPAEPQGAVRRRQPAPGWGHRRTGRGCRQWDPWTRGSTSPWPRRTRRPFLTRSSSPKNYPGQDPSNLYAMFAHDSVLIYADGAKYLRAHKMAYTGVNLVKAIKTIKTFKVAGGTTVIAPDGSSTAPITLSKITNGKFVPFATVKP